MDRYKIERRGGPGNWGPFQIIDSNVGSNKPVAVVDDGEIAQRIIDLLNEQPTIEALKQEVKDLEGRIDSIAYDIHDSYVG